MGWFSVVAFLVLIGTSMQAPKPLSLEDETINHLQDQEYEQPSHVEDETASSSVSSSIDQDDLAGQTNDDLQENYGSSEYDDDSVGSYIKKSAVRREPQTAPTNIDSVASYISQDNKDRGTVRDAIPVKNNDNGDNDDDKNEYEEDTGSNRDEATLALQGDSVASYIIHENGHTKDTIASAKPSEGDSVASYIAMNEGSPRHAISKSDHKSISKITAKKLKVKNGLEGDSVASYIDVGDGSTRGTIPQSKVNEPISPKPDSVGPYISLVDEGSQQSDTAESSTNSEGSGEAQELSGDLDSEDQKSHKAQEILQGLEHISTEKKKEVKSSKMDELSPDDIKPHQMVSEFWLERSAFSSSTPQMNSTPYDDEPFDDEMMPTQPQYIYVDVAQASEKGAVCLDGSTPGFFYRQGVGNGQRKWIIYLQGGAWCHSKMDCYKRSQSNLGSSLKFNTLINAEGVLSRDPKSNPNFYDWHVVYVPYCDGASYTGNRTKPVQIKDKMIYFRGKRILSALMDDLLGYGMNDAEKVVFSGTSAGGLAVLLHADYVRSRIPSKVGVYSLADAAIFLNVRNLKKKNAFGDLMSKVYKLHGSSKSIKEKCAKHEGKRSWKCLFPYYFGKYIESPVFVVNPLYDSWQLGNVIGIHCTKNLNRCSKKEMTAIIGFRKRTLKALGPLMKNPNITLWADGCFDHGQITFGPKWNEIRVKNRSMSGSFARWMMKEENTREIVDPELEDELFNPTCVTHQIKISKKSFTNS